MALKPLTEEIAQTILILRVKTQPMKAHVRITTAHAKTLQTLIDVPVLQPDRLIHLYRNLVAKTDNATLYGVTTT